MILNWRVIEHLENLHRHLVKRKLDMRVSKKTSLKIEKKNFFWAFSIMTHILIRLTKVNIYNFTISRTLQNTSDVRKLNQVLTGSKNWELF